MEYFERVAGPRAVVRALNQLRRTARSEVVKSVFSQLRYLPLVDSKGRKLREKKIRTGVKQKMIRDRVFTSAPNRRRPYSKLTAYTTPIPAIRLTSQQTKGGATAVKGKFIQRKTTRRRSTIGGLSVGGVVLPNAFLQISQKNKTVHVFRRNQFPTWLPGKSGWNAKPGSNQRGLRHSYDVVKFDVHEAFLKHTYPTVSRVVQQRAQLEYNRALERVGAQMLKYGR